MAARPGAAAPHRTTGGAHHRVARAEWVRRVGWLALLWLAGVLTVGAVALLLKVLMRAAGLTA